MKGLISFETRGTKSFATLSVEDDAGEVLYYSKHMATTTTPAAGRLAHDTLAKTMGASYPVGRKFSVTDWVAFRTPRDLFNVDVAHALDAIYDEARAAPAEGASS